MCDYNNEFNDFNNNEKKDTNNNMNTSSKTKKVLSAIGLGVIAGGAMFITNFAATKLTNIDETTNIVEDTSKATLSISTTNTTDNKTDITDVSDIVENAMPSIVAINGNILSKGNGYNIPGFGYFGAEDTESAVSGSGIIIGQNNNELLIVTNAHVVDDVNDLKVTFNNEVSVDAVIKASKTSKDIAIISVSLDSIDKETLSKIQIATIGDSDKLKAGDATIAIGNAMGYGQSVTTGVVSALNRSITIDNVEYNDLIQTDAAINPGNSGGALLDSNGNLIGINSAKVSDSSVEGMGYAIAINSVQELIEELMNKETKELVDESERGSIGITGMTISDDINSVYGYPYGVYIREVTENSGAKKAGLYQGDIIYEFDGQDVYSLSDLQELLQYYKEGETVKISFYRLENGVFEEKSVDVTLGKSVDNNSKVNSDFNRK